jgi:hypothetical protein
MEGTAEEEGDSRVPWPANPPAKCQLIGMCVTRIRAPPYARHVSGIAPAHRHPRPYPAPHDISATHQEEINSELLRFVES